MKIYIAGKITGDPNYREKFEKVQRTLVWLGYSVMNPACLSDDKEFSWDDYMAITSTMQERCEATVLLPDWQDSKGATMEAQKAKILGHKIFLFEVSPEVRLIPTDLEDAFEAEHIRCVKDLYQFMQKSKAKCCPWCGRRIIYG